MYGRIGSVDTYQPYFTLAVSTHRSSAHWLTMPNLKPAFRTLFKSPFVTIVAALSLALGIGANAAIYSMFDEMLRRPLPVPSGQSDRTCSNLDRAPANRPSGDRRTSPPDRRRLGQCPCGAQGPARPT